ncbi:unnamed protein product [Arabidopsis arenosa]|uniref:Ubiquitin-like protease family profile domain-containing protein n=1 Tax=Arabidopsis arenosa TaxID=38785 RepID=A0A8S2A7V3_ARAAE|nr:unnamed protein product [Arabidopsis arenosa]
MENECPKRLFTDGNEPQVEKINNSCKMSLLTKIKETLPSEYDEVKRDPVFAHVFAIHENKIVTGLKYTDDGSCDYEKWKDDKGFWSKLLKRGGDICINKLMTSIEDVKKWREKDDRIRFVYICVIAGLVMATGETKKIDHLYIKMVMDLRNVRNYPWGLKAYDYLLQCIMKARSALKKTKSYVLDGFSYALQIWVMEAIPDIGTLVGEKISTELTAAPRCSNWKGAAKVSYEDIISLEMSFTSHAVFYPFISYSGNEFIDDKEFVWPDEIRDGEVDNMIEMIKSGNDFGDHVWGSVVDDNIEGDNIENVQENDVADKDVATEDMNEVDHLRELVEDGNEENHVSGMKRSKKKQSDHGAETRKKKLLCQRAAAATHGALNDEMKSFLKALFDSSFEMIKAQLGKLEDDIALVKKLVSTSATASITTRSTTSQPSNRTDQPRKVVDEMTSLDDDFLDFSFGTQDFLDKSMGHLSQPSQLPEFDSTQNLNRNKIQSLIEIESEGKHIPDVGKNDKDAVLVFVSEARWNAFMEWNMKHKDLNFGPSVINKALLGRLLKANEWLSNVDMDAAMYLFREKSSLGRLDLARVGFMDCSFGMRLNNEYTKFVKNKRSHQWSSLIQDYANGELPPHGRTRKQWRSDFDRIYFPLHVNGNHWISLCINFIQRTVDIFDCAGHNHRRNVEAFAITIPRILKEIHTKSYGKNLLLSPYTLVHVPVPPGLNKSRCDCGVYALKYIECHFMGLPMDILDDVNIKHARQRIAVDLWEAASDPVFIDRMAKYEPPQLDSDTI